jgi:hypothetical protein
MSVRKLNVSITVINNITGKTTKLPKGTHVRVVGSRITELTESGTIAAVIPVEGNHYEDWYSAEIDPQYITFL